MHDLDIITNRPIRRPFGYSRNGVVLRLDAYPLFQYICDTGDLTDPLCKQEYAAHELSRLARLVGREWPNDLRTRFEEEVQRREVLEYLMDDLATEVRRHTEDDAFLVETVANVGTVLKSDGERAWIECRLRHSGVAEHLLRLLSPRP